MIGQSLAIPRRHWRTIAVATFFYLVVWNIASTYSALLIPSGQSAVLGFTMPLWSALIAWAVLGEASERAPAAGDRAGCGGRHAADVEELRRLRPGAARLWRSGSRPASAGRSAR